MKTKQVYVCILKKNISVHFSKSYITTVDIQSKVNSSTKLIVNPYKEPEKYEKEFISDHKNYKYVRPLNQTLNYGFQMGWFNQYRDNELGNARINSGGAYPNKLANLFFRSKVLQNSFIMNFAMKWLDNRVNIEKTVVEKQPLITTNSVFLYKDNNKYFLTRRGLERLSVAFVCALGVNLSGALLYSFILLYFGLWVIFLKLAKMDVYDKKFSF